MDDIATDSLSECLSESDLETEPVGEGLLAVEPQLAARDGVFPEQYPLLEPKYKKDGGAAEGLHSSQSPASGGNVETVIASSIDSQISAGLLIVPESPSTLSQETQVSTQLAENSQKNEESQLSAAVTITAIQEWQSPDLGQTVFSSPDVLLMSQPITTQDVLTAESSQLVSARTAVTQLNLRVAHTQPFLPSQLPILSDSPSAGLQHSLRSELSSNDTSPAQAQSTQNETSTLGNSAVESLFVKLKRSPKKEQRLIDESVTLPIKPTKMRTLMLTDEEPDDRPLFSSGGLPLISCANLPTVSISMKTSPMAIDPADLFHPGADTQSPSDGSCVANDSSRLSGHCHGGLAESQDPTSEPRRVSQEKGHESPKIVVAADGRKIPYAFARIMYYDAEGHVVYQQETDLSSESSFGSSGFLGDRSSSLTSKTSSSQPSQGEEKQQTVTGNLFRLPESLEQRRRSSQEVRKRRSHGNLEIRASAISTVETNKENTTPQSLSADASDMKVTALDISAISKHTPMEIASIVTPQEMGSKVESCQSNSEVQKAAAAADTVSVSSQDEDRFATIPNIWERTPRSSKKRTVEFTRIVRKRKTSLMTRLPEVQDSDSATSPKRPATGLPATVPGELATGARVVAMWPGDSFYYTGQVACKIGLKKWTVLFDDGQKAAVNQRDILVIDKIFRGHSVLSKSSENSDEYLPAIIQEIYPETLDYRVQFTEDQTETRVSTVDICLTSAQFRSLQLRVQAKRSSSDSDIIDRTDIIHVSPLKQETSTIKNEAITTSTPHKPLDMDAIVSVPAKTQSKRQRIFTDVQKSPIKRPLMCRQGSEPGTSTSKPIVFTETAPSRSPTNPIFHGIVFMVTSLKNDKVIDKLMDAGCLSDLSQESDKDSESIRVEVPVEKEAICAQIEELGGIVLAEYDQAVIDAASKTYLISSGFRRTVKYLQCLAAGIPPISHTWVQQCFNSRTLHPIKDFLLPAGVEIVKSSMVEWGERKEPLKDWTIFIAAIDGSSVAEDWRSILTIAGAAIAPDLITNCGKKMVMLVCSEGCPHQLLTQAKRLRVPCVSSEWAIQSLIQGSPRSLSEHPSYRSVSSELF